MKKILLALVLSIFVMTVNAQQRLLLQSGTMQTSANVEAFINSNVSSEDVFNGYYYRVVQFNSIPTTAEKERVKSSGLILMKYLPDNAFITAIPASFDKSQLRSMNVFSVINLEYAQKVSNRLLGDVPEYSKTVKGFYDVTVKYQDNITHEAALAASSQYTKIAENKANHTITLRIPQGDVQQLAMQPWVIYMAASGVPALPEDTKGRSLHKSNVINSDYASGRHYDGSGVVLAIADDGETGPHIDFTGRLTNHLTGAGGNHGDMTSGICVGAGNLDPTMRGMATGAYLHVYDITPYTHITDAVANYDTLGTVISSTSYSQGTSPGSDCNQYTTDAEFGDGLIYDNPQLLLVFSAGNQGQGNCGYPVAGGWGTITGGYKAGKAAIACGNVSNLDVLDATSSRGPVSDGRIKPDICANGLGQMSTDQDNTYQVGGGTSAASPGIAGICAQLYQAYRSMNGGANPESGLIKACLLNSAEDLGNEGPDYTYGWGRVNAYRALTTLEDGRYFRDTISQGESKSYTLNVPPGASDVRVMIYWMDPAGSSSASKALVNDLDMHLTDPINFSWMPWVLDPTPVLANITAPATHGVDTLNNMEQVSVAAGFQGTWTIHVDGTSVPVGQQAFYIVYEYRTQEIQVTYPMGGEGFVPGEQEVIRWDAVKGLGPFTIDFSTDNGTTWNNITTTGNQNTLYFTWTVPSTVTGEALIRVSRGGFTGVSDSLFSIIEVPQNITAAFTCVDSVGLTWDAVPGAVAYNIYMLGATSMDNVGTSTTNSFTVTGTNPNIDYWFSVDAITSTGVKGRRAIAVHKGPGIINCPLAYDGGVTSIISPSAGTLADCQANDSVIVTILITNTGINDLMGMDVSYSVNGGTTVTETLTDTIPVGGSLVHSFATIVDYSAIGSYDLTAWITYVGDLNIYNDTLDAVTNVITGTIATLPFTENFESYGLCSQASDCELTVCPLGNGWINEDNVVSDDIDWRVNAGPTPSNNTGPNTDHTLGTNAGQYIYLEASACFGKTAELLTPCLDLTNISGPQLRFWYHMQGPSMGDLHVDVLANGIWTEDVMTPLVGNQSNNWTQTQVNLAAFAGEIITIRFRGVTGTAGQSDIAIDDINVLNTNVPPVPAFVANYTTTCTGNAVTLTDQSTFSPTAWLWTITPNTVTYVNGTTANSQNPQVQFNSIGAYTIQLNASNAFGVDSTSLTSYINIIGASSIALVEDFQGATWPPAGFRVESAGNNYTWEPAFNIVGSNGGPTNAAMINNYDYAPAGAEDGLTRVEVDLGTAVTPMMLFDRAYARFNNFTSDALRIDISTDCGNTFNPSGYQKQGAALATTPNSMTPFTPASATQWRNDTLNLTPWAGQTVTLRFTNISSSGNRLYIDNINIADFTGINEPSLKANVSIYPNPSSSGIFTVVMNGLKDVNAELTVTDAQGKLVEHYSAVTTTSYSGTIDLSSRDKGVYFLEIRTETGVSRYKLSVM